MNFSLLAVKEKQIIKIQITEHEVWTMITELICFIRLISHHFCFKIFVSFSNLYCSFCCHNLFISHFSLSFCILVIKNLDSNSFWIILLLLFTALKRLLINVLCSLRRIHWSSWGRLWCSLLDVPIEHQWHYLASRWWRGIEVSWSNFTYLNYSINR